MSVKVLCFAGSARKDSVNKKLVSTFSALLEKAGAQVDLIDLKDYPMPIYDGDLESQEGLPATARNLKQKFLENDALVIASPEYNSSISPLLKNTLDWVSRAESNDEAPLEAYRGKSAILLSASPGALGGLRGLVHLRAILGNIGVTVVPDQKAVSSAYEKFSADGELQDEQLQSQLLNMANSFVALASSIKNAGGEE